MLNQCRSRPNGSNRGPITPFAASAPIARTPAASVGSSTSISPPTKPTSAATIRAWPELRELVTINTDRASDDNYARIASPDPDCPFLAEGWCSIQKNLGEQYLSIMCSQYPRVMNMVDDVLQRSLDLSCPEAARVMLLDPNPMEFDEEEARRAIRGTAIFPSCAPAMQHPPNRIAISARFAIARSGCSNIAASHSGNASSSSARSVTNCSEPSTLGRTSRSLRFSKRTVMPWSAICLAQREQPPSAAGQATRADAGADRRPHRLRFHGSAPAGLLSEVHAEHGVDAPNPAWTTSGGATLAARRNICAPFHEPCTATCWSTTW